MYEFTPRVPFWGYIFALNWPRYGVGVYGFNNLQNNTSTRSLHANLNRFLCDIAVAFIWQIEIL